MNTLLELPKDHRTGEANETDVDQRMNQVMASVDDHHCALLDYVHRLTGNLHDASDIVAEVWRYVFLNFPSDKIGSYPLLRLKAKHLFLDHVRAAKRRPEVLTDELPEVASNPHQETVYSEASEQELQQRFFDGFPGIKLSDLQRKVLFMHARDGLTYIEIEAKLHVPRSTVGDWVNLGRERIAAYLDTHS